MVNFSDFAILANHWNDKPLFISEFMASNGSSVPLDAGEILDGNGESSDWIEIHNAGSVQINLEGYYLTDDPCELTKWQFPAGVNINTGSYLIVFASGKDQEDDPGNYPYLDPDGYYHTNFKLSAGGEYLALIEPDGQTIVNDYDFPAQETDVSYGLYDNLVRYFGFPTPCAPNNEGYIGMVADTKFSHDRGFYETSFDVAITCDTPDANIYYTLDGSVPINENGLPVGTEYTGPVTIIKDGTWRPARTLRAAAFKAGWYPSNIDTQTYIFLNDVILQPNNPPGFPSDWKGNYVDPGDLPPGGEVPADYEMDPDIVIGNENHVKDALLSLPVVSIATDINNLFDLETGIYANSWEGGIDWERPASAEFFEPNSTRQFQVNCGLRIHGGWFRKPRLTNKHSFRLLFKSGYGPTKLEFPLFDDENATDSFDSIILRANGGDGYSYTMVVPAQYIRDEFVRQLQLAMGHVSPHGFFVHLYVNGLYWGLYNIVERPEASFSATYFGGDKENWDVLKIDRTEQVTAAHGNMDAWDAMLDQVRSGLSTNEAYQRIQGNNPDGSPNESYPDYLEIVNYIDYMIDNIYVGNKDWPQWNWYAVRDRNDGRTGFRFFVWDAETSLDDAGINRTDVGSPTAWHHEYGPGVAEPYHELRNNAEFRMLFADRLHKAFFNGGPLTTGAVVARYSNIADMVDPAMTGECARWGDQHSSQPTIENWRAIRDWILTSYLENRSAIVLEQFRDGGLYPSLYPDVVAPVFTPHGGEVPSGFALPITAGPGTIWYTTDGSDPRLPGGAVNTPSATAYTVPVVLTETTCVKARVLDSEWSALNEAVFAIGPVVDNLRITEIMYHPADPNAEFIELKNVGAEAINPALARFTNGIDFTFPSMQLNPGDYVLVAENPAELAALAPDIPVGVEVLGPYTGKLDNGGEKIVLVDAIGQTIHEFRYKDGWYDITDGEGFSLTIKDPASSDPNLWDNKSGWRPSASVGGSPGEDDSGEIPELGAIKINELLSHSNVLYTYDWVELYNTTDANINIGGWYLSDDNDNFKKYTIPVGTVVDANDFYVLRQDLHFGVGNPADPNNVPFALSSNGETLYLHSGQDGVLTGYSEEETFGASESDVSFGRYEKSTGTFNFVAMSDATPDLPNAYPKVGPVVISEIMYHPQTESDAEYVELVNISGSTITLHEWDNQNGINVPWRFTDEGGITFDFPLGTTMNNDERILLVKDETIFNIEFPGVSSVQIFEWGSGKLDNAGEKIQLSKPGDEVDGTRYYIRVDRVNYSDGSHPVGDDPWPTGPDGYDQSLTRIDPNLYGNDVINWRADDPSPGTANP